MAGFPLYHVPLAARAFLAGLILTWARALGEFGATILFAGILKEKHRPCHWQFTGFETNGNSDCVVCHANGRIHRLTGADERLERRSDVDTHPE